MTALASSAPRAAPIRVVVADDSAMMRQIVSASLTRAGIHVTGTAANGDEALAVCERLGPDALMLDLTMPGLDGIGVLKRLQGLGRRLPVIVVSAFSPAQGARAVDALAEGAFDLVPKPAAGEGLDGFATALVEKVRAATASVPSAGSTRVGVTPHHRRPLGGARTVRNPKVVVIATSTGGPKALAALVPRLPGRLGAGTLIVQHMPPHFTKSLASRLDSGSALTVQEAAGGEILDPRVALIARGGWHLRLDDAGRTRLSDEPEIGALRPRADLTIEDVARVYRERTLLVVLTGMGEDGLAGAAAVKRHGGRVFAQERESCTVYGMPRAVVDAELADETLALEDLAAAITEEAA